MHLRSILLSLSVAGLSIAHAQDHEWWARNVGWNGSDPWMNYLQLSPAHMGPNALPVPEMHWIDRDSTSWFMGQAQVFLHQQEITVASRLALLWRPSPWFRFRAHVVPVEWFETSHDLKTDRRIFHENYDDRIAGGDIHVESFFTLPWRLFRGGGPEVRIAVKTASGTNLGSARYTDTPGYTFSVSDRWQLSPEHAIEAMLGLFVYQTYSELHRQNDCFLWGAGHSWSIGKFRLFHAVRGYQGYLRNGDAPVVYDAEFNYRAGPRSEFHLGAGVGINDHPFRSIAIGLRWHFKAEYS